MQDIERVLELVHYFHPPLPIRLEPAVQASQYLAGCDGCLLPGGMLVRQLLALVVELIAVVVNVKKIPGHGRVSCKAAACS